MANKKYHGKDVDNWVKENGTHNARALLQLKIPGIIEKLERLDKRLINVLKEINEVFPDAIYYTASGGFNVVLGETHRHD